jgi:hypothetical protein
MSQSQVIKTSNYKLFLNEANLMKNIIQRGLSKH